MDKDESPRLVGESGVTSVQFLLASALAVLLFVVFANLVVVQYGRGAMRSALEQGVRAGSVSGPIACETAARSVVAGLLGGAMSDGLAVNCSVEGGEMVATGTAVFMSWTPLTPDFEVAIESRAIQEP